MRSDSTVPDLTAVKRCPSKWYELSCDLEPGHEGKHGEVMGHDEEGRVDDAVTWEFGTNV